MSATAVGGGAVLLAAAPDDLSGLGVGVAAALAVLALLAAELIMRGCTGRSVFDPRSRQEAGAWCWLAVAGVSGVLWVLAVVAATNF